MGNQGLFQGASKSSLSTASKAKGGGGGGGAFGIIGAIGTGISSYYNIRSMKDTMKFNRAMAELDKRVVRLSANEQIKRIREQADDIFSAQKAGYARKGIDIGTGSPLAVMANSLADAEMDAIFTDINADLGVSSIETRSRIDQMENRSARIALIADTIGSLSKKYSSYIINK